MDMLTAISARLFATNLDSLLSNSVISLLANDWHRYPICIHYKYHSEECKKDRIFYLKLP